MSAYLEVGADGPPLLRAALQVVDRSRRGPAGCLCSARTRPVHRSPQFSWVCERGTSSCCLMEGTKCLRSRGVCTWARAAPAPARCRSSRSPTSRSCPYARPLPVTERDDRYYSDSDDEGGGRTRLSLSHRELLGAARGEPGRDAGPRPDARASRLLLAARSRRRHGLHAAMRTVPSSAPWGHIPHRLADTMIVVRPIYGYRRVVAAMAHGPGPSRGRRRPHAPSARGLSVDTGQPRASAAGANRGPDNTSPARRRGNGSPRHVSDQRSI